MPDPARVVAAAMALRGAESEVWNEFVSAMREYAATLAMEVLKHPPETLLRAQGAAMAANEIATILHTAPQLYEKTKERRQHG
jgi:hypothetical protein